MPSEYWIIWVLMETSVSLLRITCGTWLLPGGFGMRTVLVDADGAGGRGGPEDAADGVIRDILI